MKKMDKKQAEKHEPYCVVTFENNEYDSWSCICNTLRAYDEWRKTPPQRKGVREMNPKEKQLVRDALNRLGSPTMYYNKLVENKERGQIITAVTKILRRLYEHKT